MQGEQCYAPTLRPVGVKIDIPSAAQDIAMSIRYAATRKKIEEKKLTAEVNLHVNSRDVRRAMLSAMTDCPATLR